MTLSVTACYQHTLQGSKLAVGHRSTCPASVMAEVSVTSLVVCYKPEAWRELYMPIKQHALLAIKKGWHATALVIPPQGCTGLPMAFPLTC